MSKLSKASAMAGPTQFADKLDKSLDRLNAKIEKTNEKIEKAKEREAKANEKLDAKREEIARKVPYKEADKQGWITSRLVKTDEHKKALEADALLTAELEKKKALENEIAEVVREQTRAHNANAEALRVQKELLEQQQVAAEKQLKQAKRGEFFSKMKEGAKGLFKYLSPLYLVDLGKKFKGFIPHIFKGKEGAEGIAKGMHGAFKGVKTFTLALLGARTIFTLVRKAMREIMADNEQLANTINALWNGMVAAIAPVVNAIVSMLATAVNYILSMIQLISGLNIFGFISKADKKARAKKAGAGGGGGGNTLASFDKSEVLKKESGAGSAGATDNYIKQKKLGLELKEIAEKIKRIWTGIAKVVHNITQGIKKGLEYMNSGQRILEVMKKLLHAILDDIIEMVDATVQWSANLNFGFLFAAMATALESLEPILERIGDLFSWIYIQMLLPLGKYIIEELAPAFLNLIAPILDVVEAIASGMQPIFERLWKDTLAPMFAFIGSTVVELLNWLAEWFIENKESIAQLFETLTRGIEFLTNVLAPIVTAVVSRIKEDIKIFFEFVGGLIANFQTVLKGLIEFLSGVFTGDWERAWNGLAMIVGGVWNAIIDTIEMAVNGIVNAINMLINGINGLSVKIPDIFGGGSIGFNFNTLNKVDLSSWKYIPKLAQGAVIPPNKEFLAILGDQTRGRNIETPEGLLRQIVQEETPQQPIYVTVTGEGDIDQIIRLFQFKAKQEENRIGTVLVEEGGR